jgi:hypothetical protein
MSRKLLLLAKKVNGLSDGNNHFNGLIKIGLSDLLLIPRSVLEVQEFKILDRCSGIFKNRRGGKECQGRKIIYLFDFI